MSILSVLGKIGKGVGSALPIVGPILGAIGSGRAKGRVDEGTLQSLIAERYNQAALDRSRLALGAQGQRQGQLVGADLLSSMHAPTDPRAMKFATGSAVSPETIAGIRARATGALQSGSDVPPLQMPQIPQAGKLDSLLSMLGLAGTGLGAYDEWRKRQGDVTPPGGYD